MYRVSLADLRRAGLLRVEHLFPEDDPLWTDVDVVFAGPVGVSALLSRTASGQVIAVGELVAPLIHECRRCLDRVDRSHQLPFEFLWFAADQLSDDRTAEGNARILEEGAGEVDLGEAIREELVLAAPKYVLCREDCHGLCPRCGANLNEEGCECVIDEPDPRWDALRALNKP